MGTMYDSVALDMPIEIIETDSINPLISKCQIKVCYVGDEPNRNGTVITKELAKKLANSLPGSPIVGHYDAGTKDFDEHNRILKKEQGKWVMLDDTRPYGFVDLGANCWFQWFSDEGVEREYLVTEGYIWTGQYPESQRIIDEGNNQSMELDDDTCVGTWSKGFNGKQQFFIINEAIISKLCVLGEDVEPCFEGASVTEPKLEFSLGEDFKNKMYSLINEMKEILSKGGTPMYKVYAVSIGSDLFWGITDYIYSKYGYNYSVYGVYEEGEQKFAIIKDCDSLKLYRLDFTLTEENGLSVGTELKDVALTFSESNAAQYSEEELLNFAENYKAKKEEEKSASEDKKEKEEECPKCGKPLSECECEEEDEDKKKYSLEDIPEYMELKNSFDELQNQYSTLTESANQMKALCDELMEFKNSVEKTKKKEMIDKFYMLSDEDKAEVIDNIDKYSLEDIEAKLSVICFRKKVSFEEVIDDEETSAPTTYSLETLDVDDAPAWVKSLRQAEKTIK